VSTSNARFTLLLTQIVPMFSPLVQALFHTRLLPGPVRSCGALEVLYPFGRGFHLVVTGLVVLCKILERDRVRYCAVAAWKISKSGVGIWKRSPTSG
jgi:hypothetical protein